MTNLDPVRALAAEYQRRIDKAESRLVAMRKNPFASSDDFAEIRQDLRNEKDFLKKLNAALRKAEGASE